MHGIDVYRTYLAFKQHFSNPDFDFFKYDGKVKAKESTYHDRSDFYFFETLARKLTDREVLEYMLASFVISETPQKVWIGDIRRSGKEHWLSWQRTHSSLQYIFSQEMKAVRETGTPFNDLFNISEGHPPILKLHIKGVISLETLLVLDVVLGFLPLWDKKLRDPLWEQISFKIRKYKPFLSIKTSNFRDILRDLFS